MTKRLFIAEKPELAKAITEGLGGDLSKSKRNGYYQVGNDLISWCYGHMLALCDPEDYDEKYKQWRLSDLPFYFPDHKYKPLPKSKDQLDILLDLIKKSDEIVHAGDPDGEGQLLVDEVLWYASNSKPVNRVLINDLNKRLVVKALDNLKSNDDFNGLSQSALARSIADQTYGYNLTRAYTIGARKAGLDGVFSVGRVQTPILGLVVRRDEEIESHRSSFYFNVSGEFISNDITFKARLYPSDDARKDDKGRLVDEAYANAVCKDCKGSPATLINASTEHKTSAPPLPHNLLTLQAEANKLYNIKADQTLKITQALREKYKLITYNRSDCQYLSEEQHDDASSVLAAVSKNFDTFDDASLKTKEIKSLKSVGDADNTIKSRAFNSKNVTAHHAIIPTEATVDMSDLTNNERKIYALIARLYIAQFFPHKEYDQTELTLICNEHTFKLTSRVTTHAGWELVLGKESKDSDEDDDSTDLRDLKEGDDVSCNDCIAEKKKTKPKSYYTEAALLKDLQRVAKYVDDKDIRALLVKKDEDKKGEHGGIGTPATRSSMIETLKTRGYIIEDGRYIKSSSKGRSMIHTLPKSATIPDMTALWYEKQAEIEDNNLTVDNFMDDVNQYIKKEVNRVRVDGVNVKDDTQITCPTCKEGKLRKRKGANGVFWGCSLYPECKATFPDKKGKPDLNAKKKPVPSKHKCPSCDDGMLIRRKSKKGKGFWWGCSNFPECKYTCFDDKGKPKHKD